MDCSRTRHLNNLSSDTEVAKAIRDIDRKLKTRCVGLLEAGNALKDSSDRDWYDRDRILMEERLGNRRLQYLHRTTKEFLDLEETKSLLRGSMAVGCDPKLALLWSAIQRIRIYEPEQHKGPMVDREPKNDLFCLADSALLLAKSLQDEENCCPVELLDLLDSTMQHKYCQLQKELPWVIEAMNKLHRSHDRYGRPSIGRNISTDGSDEYIIEYFDPRFNDDLLSLAIIYGLVDYVKFDISRHSLVVDQKSGRLYLDYALASHNNRSVDVSLGMIHMLLEAGANLNSYCPTVYSIPGWQGRGSHFGYNTWIPWKSALESFLRTAAGEGRWQSTTLSSQQRQDWINVFTYLLTKSPDVDVNVYAKFKVLADQSFTVIETIIAVLAKRILTRLLSF